MLSLFAFTRKRRTPCFLHPQRHSCDFPQDQNKTKCHDDLLVENVSPRMAHRNSSNLVDFFNRLKNKLLPNIELNFRPTVQPTRLVKERDWELYGIIYWEDKHWTQHKNKMRAKAADIRSNFRLFLRNCFHSTTSTRRRLRHLFFFSISFCGRK